MIKLYETELYLEFSKQILNDLIYCSNITVSTRHNINITQFKNDLLSLCHFAENWLNVTTFIFTFRRIQLQYDMNKWHIWCQRFTGFVFNLY